MDSETFIPENNDEQTSENSVSEKDVKEYRVTKGAVFIVNGFPWVVVDVRLTKVIIRPAFPYSYANGVITLSKNMPKKEP